MHPHPPPAGAGASPGQGGSCPDDALLVGLVEARLPADEAEAARRHVQACPACREQVGVLASVLGEPAAAGADLRPDAAPAPGARRSTGPWRLAAAAALLLGLLSGAWWLARDGDQPGHGGPSAPGAADEALRSELARARAAEPALQGFELLSAAELGARPRSVLRGALSVAAPRGATLAGTPELAWSAVPGASTYVVTVRDEEGRVRLERTVASTALTWPAEAPALAEGARYVLRVKAQTPAGTVEGSEAFDVLRAAEARAYAAGLQALARAPGGTRALLQAHLAARHRLWAEAATLVSEAAAQGAPSEALAALRARIEHELGRALR